MKRLWSLLLVLVMVLSLAACSEKPTESKPPEPPPEPTTLIVGSPELNGNFIAGFGSNAYDVWVRNLIHGYETYAVTPGGEIVLNETVVKDLKTEKDAAGNKTYTFEIHKDLKWNDGSTITAKDFVFHILWSSSPEWVKAGATTSVGDGLLGYKAYKEGETDRFKGVKLIGDYSFSVTIDAEELPYFYETTYASFIPYPMMAWAKDATIDQNDDGAKISGIDLVAATSAAATGDIRFRPKVTSGPYKFISYENNAVSLEKNDLFKGTFDKKKPQIDFVIIKSINQTTDVDQVINGEVDMVTGVIEGEKIEKAKAAATTDLVYYPRNGFGGVFFHCDFGPAAVADVRHALAYLMDRDEVIANVLGGYGSVTNGHYGLAQWMYEDNKAEIDAFPHFSRNIAKANEFLDKTEWKYESNGKTPFDPAKANAEGTYIRHNSKKQKLVINHLGSEDNVVTDNVELQWKANAPLAGIEFTLTRSDFANLLNHYYNTIDPSQRKYHSFNLATSFSVAYDPYYSFHSDWYGTRFNSCQVKDAKIDELTVKMRSLEPTQVEEFSAAWLEWQKYYYEYLPILPLYSNQYYDIFSKKLKGVNCTPFVNWSNIICDITKSK